jgi:putative aldouronate transport system substrate-binding protein
MPMLFLPDEQDKEASAIITEVRTYVDEMANKFIQGAEPLNDTTFGNFINTLKAMNIERVVGYYNTAYQKYLQN